MHDQNPERAKNNDCSVLNNTTMFDNDRKEHRKLLNIGLGEEKPVILNIQVDSATSINLLKRNVLH